MATRHTVKEGECISSIAAGYGFFRKTLEEHLENATLKQERKNLNMLLPGDQVTVPELRARWERVPVGASHRFRRKGVPEIFCIRFADAEGKPRAAVPYRLRVDGAAPLEGATDGRGMVRRYIPPDARRVDLELGAGAKIESYAFDLGKLAPPTTVAGAQARLKSLGFYAGEHSGELDAATRDALRAFQTRRELLPTGELDDVTADAVKQAYEAR